MAKFIDTHIHLQDFKPDFAPQVLANPEMQKAVLISAEVKDWEPISKLVKAYSDKLIPAFGVHPWHYDEKFDIELLKEKLRAFPNALVGEIGVDQLKEPVNEKQHQLFSAQIRVAKEFNRPVVVHAAKAFTALTEHEKELREVRYVHHGFTKNFELLKFIIRTGGYIGLSALFLRQEKASEMFQMIPEDKVLFETDAPYQADETRYNEIVQENLLKLSAIAGVGVEDLSARLLQNAERFIGVGG